MGGLAYGLLASLLVTLGGCAICATLISSESIAATAANYCVLGILLISAFAGAKIAIIRSGEKRLLVGTLTGALYLVVLLAMTALFFGGQYEGVGETALVVITGGIVAAIIGINGKKRGISHKSKIRHR